jgi:NAD(P)-dependent dehydrogenase (short-subunit alcohol dehydrogenase family)
MATLWHAPSLSPFAAIAGPPPCREFRTSQCHKQDREGLLKSSSPRVRAWLRRTDEGEALATRCGEALSFVRAYVSKEVDVKTMIDHAVARLGRLDCLVNNAGISAPMVSIADVTEEQFQTVFDVNVLCVMLCIKRAAPIICSAKGRGALSTSPAARVCGRSFPVMFIAAQKRLRSTSRVRPAAELSQHGIRANSISPGDIVTGIFAKVAGVSGADADRVLGVVADRFKTGQPIPRAGATTTSLTRRSSSPARPRSSLRDRTSRSAVAWSHSALSGGMRSSPAPGSGRPR